MNKYDALINRTSKRLRIYRHMDRLLPEKVLQNNPVTLEVHPTNKCNINCLFCSYQNINDKKSMDNDTFIKLIQDIISCNINAVVFSGGGEPTMHPLLVYAIDRLSEAGIEIGLITNAVSISQNLLSVISKCTWIRVSLNAISSEDYEQLTGLSNDIYKHIIQNIIEISTRTKNTTTTLGISLLISETGWDIEHFFKSIDLAQQLQIDQIFFRPLLDGFDNTQHFRGYQNYIEDIISYASEQNIVTNIRKFMEGQKLPSVVKNKNEACTLLSYNLVGLVTACGDIYPCLSQYLNYPENSFGNIHNTNLQDAYTKKSIQALEEKIRKKPCKQCRYANLISEINIHNQHNDVKECRDIHYNFL